jgi:hypothetical protein
MDDNDKPVLNQADLYEYLHDELGIVGVTRSTIKWAVTRRELSPTKIGRTLYFSKNEALRWLESCRLPA